VTPTALSSAELLAAALRGEPAPWPPAAEAAFETALLNTAIDHGVAALLATTAAIDAWPEKVRRALREVRRDDAVLEALRRRMLQQVIAAFAAGGIPCLVIKGAQLAYTHYAHPWLRPRSDTDLLIRPADRDRADAALRAMGYVAKPQISGTLVHHQRQYERVDRLGLTDTVDLHWKITNPHLFADVLTFDELIGAARPIPQLGGAMGPAAVHALLLACVHRVAHHQNSDLLMWLHDIHLIASAMDGRERQEFAELARRKRVRSVCAAGLDHAQRHFGTVHPAGWRDRFDVRAGDQAEPSSAFLQPDARRIDMLLWDLRALGGWTRRIRLIQETVFPPVAYVRARYGPDTPLILAYMDRIVSGARKWFRPSA
jgi:hypothetical protein